MHHAFAPTAPPHFCYNAQQLTAPPHVKQSLLRNRKKYISANNATSIPSFPNPQGPPTAGNPSLTKNLESATDSGYSTAKSVLGLSSYGKWHRDDESALKRSEPLPLPMTFPGSAPAREEVEKMKNCDPVVKDCRDVIYQWTGECSRCQGTGDIWYHKKEGGEVFWKCVTCLGLGHVHKVTFRTDIDIVEEVGVV